MHRTTLILPDELIRKAKLKAASEGVSVSEVLRKLLRRWVHDEVRLDAPDPRSTLRNRALATFGIWRDRDPDQYLRNSRAGLADRDTELEDARLDV